MATEYWVWGVNAGGNIYWKTASSSNPDGGAWTCVAGALTAVACGGGQVWGVNSADAIWYRQGVTPANPGGVDWVCVPGALKTIAVDSHGVAWGTNAGHQIYRRTGVTPANPMGSGWVQLDGAATAIAASGNHLVVANKANEIYVRNGFMGESTGTWGIMAGALCQVDVTDSGAIWGCNSGDLIWHKATRWAEWQQIPGALTCVSAADDHCIWGVNRAGCIYRYNNAGGWVCVAGALVNISVGVAPAGRSFVVWGVNASQKIWFKDNVSTANPHGGPWQNIDGAAVHVSCGGGNVWVVNSADAIWARTGVTRACPQGTSWAAVPGALTAVTCGTDGSVWGVNRGGNIYRRTGVSAKNPIGADWQCLPGALVSIAAGSHCVAGCNAGQSIYHRTGLHASDAGDNWKELGGAAVKCSVDNMNGTWVVNAGGALYHWPATGSAWQHVAAAPAGCSSVGAAGPHLVFVTTNAGTIHVTNNGGASWQTVEGQLNQIEASTL
jgi:virginiamycin B lyase